MSSAPEHGIYRRLTPLAIATFAVGTNSMVIAGILPRIADSLEVSTSQAGYLVTAFALVYAVCAPVLSALTGNVDRRYVLLGALAVFTVGNVVVATANTFGQAMAGRVISAMGSALIVSVAMATATAIAPPHARARALAVVTVGLTVATTAGVPLGTLIGGADWRITMWVVCGLGLVAALGIALALPQVELPSMSLRQRVAPLRSGAVLSILGVSWLILTSGYVLYTYIDPLTASATGSNAARLTIVLACYGVGSLVGNIASGFLTDRFGAMKILIVGLVVVVTTLALTPLATGSFSTTLIWAAVWGTSGWLTGLPQQHRLVARAPESAAVLLGLNAAVLQLGIAGGSALGAQILPHGTTALAMASAALVALALVLTVAGSLRRSNPEPRPQ